MQVSTTSAPARTPTLDAVIRLHWNWKALVAVGGVVTIAAAVLTSTNLLIFGITLMVCSWPVQAIVINGESRTLVPVRGIDVVPEGVQRFVLPAGALTVVRRTPGWDLVAVDPGGWLGLIERPGIRARHVRREHHPPTAEDPGDA